MEEQDVKALERDLEERPWVFGFKQVGNKAEREKEKEREGGAGCLGLIRWVIIKQRERGGEREKDG